MKLRPPAIPLITVDPYFSIWSKSDKLYGDTITHWSSKPNTILGIVEIDGEEFGFMGLTQKPEIPQINLDVDTFSTTYTFQNNKIKLEIKFTSPLFPDDYEILTRPVSYMKANYTSTDGKEHDVKIKIAASEELCINLKGSEAVLAEEVYISEDIKAHKIGSVAQNILKEKGDDVRINWGYFYLAVKGCNAKTSSFVCEKDNMSYISAEVSVCPDLGAMFFFAYDDISSLIYFGDVLKSFWNKDGKTIKQAIIEADSDYNDVFIKCDEFSKDLFMKATLSGGEKYAELLMLSFRQVMAAHKLVLDKNGEILFISKECFSGGMTATVDVSYPSIPMFLYYNTELIKGMLRPVYTYAKSKAWPFDFAPHDVGLYPDMYGQYYSNGTDIERQMPVEECGNMLVMEACVAICDNDASFAEKNLDLLKTWAKYLLKYGTDPENQLCTDDFAGHMAHNCNLSLKAICGIAGLSIICDMLGRKEESSEYMQKAREISEIWLKTAANGDGSYKLAFDRQGSFSMKYNIIWDKLWGTNLFPKEFYHSEFASYKHHINPYGLPLDNRNDYTKSDWLVWIATFAENRNDFEEFIEPLWKTYHYTRSRVPMTDWYDTITSAQVGFQHRTVQGGLFIKLLEVYGNIKLK